MSLLLAVTSLRRCGTNPFTELPLSTSPTTTGFRVFDIPSRRNSVDTFIGSNVEETITNQEPQYEEKAIALRVTSPNFSAYDFSREEEEMDEEVKEEGSSTACTTSGYSSLNGTTYRKLLHNNKRKPNFQDPHGYTGLNNTNETLDTNHHREPRCFPRKKAIPYRNIQTTLLRMERKQNVPKPSLLPPTKKVRSLITKDSMQGITITEDIMQVDLPEPIVQAARIRDHFFLQNTCFPDWTREFQEILKRNPLERGTELQRLCDQFVETAKKFGQIIIKERNEPYEKKTIKPLQGKGIAGGEKYKVANIFFKFAIDHNDIYGSDQYAMKVAGHELKGLTAFVSSGMMLGLNFPLLALIDYRGFRLVATSVLPISEDTIVYGSCDGGVTVHTDVPEMNMVMEKIAKVLNLKGHLTGIGKEKKWLYGPCDIEGHRASDGKQYIIDTSRVWPCETPDRSLRGGFLFQLLRGEFVSRYPIPLNSDAFSMFGEHDAATHNREVSEATQYLLNTIIPVFAAFLDRVEAEGSIILSIENLPEHLHRAGINIRHLGRVRMHAKSPEVKRLILLEIIARTLKNVLKAEMRKVPSNDELKFRTVIIEFFNLIFGSGVGSHVYWMTKLKLDATRQFCHSLTVAERQRDHDLRTQLDMDTLYNRIQVLGGVSFCEKANPLKAPLTDEDLQEIVVREKHMYAIPRIEADTLAEIARTKDGQEAIDLYTLSQEKYRSVLELKPDDYSVLQNLGTVISDMAKLVHSNGDTARSDQLFQQAYHTFACSLAINKDDHKALNRWGNSLCEQAATKSYGSQQDLLEANHLYATAAEKYRRANVLRPTDPDILYNWGNQLRHHAKVLVKLSRSDEAERLLLNSLGKYRACTLLAKKDILAVDSHINWGCALLALGKLKSEAAATFFGQAKQQFLKAAELIKNGELLGNQTERAREYLAICAYNVACIQATAG